MPIALRPLPDLTPEQTERFHASYRRFENGCWVWTRHVSQRGYAIFSASGRTLRANRVSFYLRNGQPNGLVCHSCDDRRCVNPDHLWDGTPRANMTDMVAKGRHVAGGATRYPFGAMLIGGSFTVPLTNERCPDGCDRAVKRLRSAIHGWTKSNNLPHQFSVSVQSGSARCVRTS